MSGPANLAARVTHTKSSPTNENARSFFKRSGPANSAARVTHTKSTTSENARNFREVRGSVIRGRSCNTTVT